MPRGVLGLVLMLGAIGWGTARQRSPAFDHARHAAVFPSCLGCHAGAAASDASLWPEATTCASCHDGTIQKRVRWTGPSVHETNLRFTHARHGAAFASAGSPDSMPRCTTCHQPAGGGWMKVVRTSNATCLGCHAPGGSHLTLPDTACATCHLTLAEAPTLTEGRISAFPAPPSHQETGFLLPSGHGAQARGRPGTGSLVAASCATCHARDFCASCHVNADQVPLIQALAPDPRSLAIATRLHAPTTHADQNFLTRHGGMASRDVGRCATCHTQESCVACHRGQPAVASALVSVRGQARGAKVVRQPPASHEPGFADTHGPAASARPSSCAACHARVECLDCHRPAAGNSGSYHRAGFLTSHPAAAFNRQSDCAECHNTQQFCTTCHTQSGLTSRRTLQGGYHDANGAFLLQHGPSARRNLESCVTCHTERDCLTCHSAQTRRFNPHGPGFDAERLRKRNPQTCSACHGQNIPGG